MDVTNADTRVRAGRDVAACKTPCALTLALGTQRLVFEYEHEGRTSSDEAFVSVSEQPQVYRRTVRQAHVRSPAGRITAITLWAVGQAAMFTALVSFAAPDTDALTMARRGLGYGGLGATALMFPIALVSVRRTRGVGVQFPWEAPPSAGQAIPASAGAGDR